MISYHEALARARTIKPNIDACDEYNDAYVFKTRADHDTIGGDSPCVILKESGEAINIVEYFDNYEAEHIREFDLQEAEP